MMCIASPAPPSASSEINAADIIVAPSRFESFG